MILVELCSQQVPYSSLYLTPLQVAIGVADRGLRPPLEATDIPIPVRRIVDKCLAQDPLQRPNFVALVSQLKAIVSSVAAAEERVDAAPSLLSRMSQGLGMLQGSAPRQTASTTEMGKSNAAGTRNSASPQSVSVRTAFHTCEGGKHSPCSPPTVHSSSQGSQAGVSSGLPPPGPRRSTGVGMSLAGIGSVGGATGSTGGGTAQAFSDSAQAAAGKASAILVGFLNRARSSPQH